jgi:hypothetical protein
VQTSARSGATIAVRLQVDPLQLLSATQTAVRMGWPSIIEYVVSRTDTICGKTTGVVISTSKKLSGLPSWVTRKCCAVTARSGRHCTSRPVRPEEA